MRSSDGSSDVCSSDLARAFSHSASVAPVAWTDAPASWKHSAIAPPMPPVPPVTRTRHPSSQSRAHSADLADELVNIIRSQPNLIVVLPAHVDLREDVLIADLLIVLHQDRKTVVLGKSVLVRVDL